MTRLLQSGRPSVAVVGRPNVGKSTVFNRLLGRRLAIVHAQSGTTRDRLVRAAEWNGRRFDLVDTGGITNLDDAAVRPAIEAGVRRQVEAALKEAAACLFVVDVQTGRHPLDDYVAGLLHRAGLPVLVAANKADAPVHEPAAAEFERYGFPVFPVSALHARGFDELRDALAARLPASDAPDDAPDALKVAVVGRPNVGKSSYLNRLLRDERVIVSETPGTTRDSVEIPFRIGERTYVLADTAGIRKMSRVTDGIDRFSLIRTEEAIGRADVAAVIADATQGVTAQDRAILGRVLEAGRGAVLIVNKWDLAALTQRAFLEEWGPSLAGLEYVPVVFVSSLTGYNVTRSVETLDRVAACVRANVPTPALNRAIESACSRTRAPMVGGRRLRIYYASQTGVQPTRIALFVNDPQCLRPAFQAYLVRALREAFGLEGTPVRLIPRRRSRPGGPKHGGPRDD